MLGSLAEVVYVLQLHKMWFCIIKTQSTLVTVLKTSYIKYFINYVHVHRPVPSTIPYIIYTKLYGISSTESFY